MDRLKNRDINLVNFNQTCFGSHIHAVHKMDFIVVLRLISITRKITVF